jgi:hypothetical protein
MMRNFVMKGVGVSATLALCLAAQAGEDCASANPVGLGTTAITIGAVTDSAPGATCNTFSANDVYFTFTPATSGTYDFNTCGAAATGWFDTVLSVYSGVCGATTQLGCNDDNGNTACGTNGWSSNINGLSLVGGETYIIRVADYDGFSFGDGNGFLTIAAGGPPPTPPANDLCTNAEVVAAPAGDTTYTFAFNNTNANTEGPAATCGFGGNTGTRDVFFSLTAAATASYQIDTSNSLGLTDTILQVIDGSCAGPVIACDDDSGDPGLQSLVNVSLNSGQTVLIRVSSWSTTAQGAGVLNIRWSTTPTNPVILATTSTIQELGTDLVGVFIQPGANPTSTWDTTGTVTIDLSSIGGSATQALTRNHLFDPDVVFTYSATLPISVLSGTYVLPAVSTDDQGRAATPENCTLTVLDGPSGACCVSSACSIARETTCFAATGTWQGAGSGCGGAGYTHQVAATGNDFFAIAGTGTILSIASSCDDCTEDLAMPFPFNFYGAAVTNVAVSSNGNVQFVAAGTGSGQFGNTTLPDPFGPLNAIFPAWDDYNPGVQGDVYYQVFGTSPDRILKISWEGVTEFGLAVPNNNNFQITFFEGVDDFIVQYGTMDNMPEAFAGDITIGTQDATGSSASTQATGDAGDDTEFEWNPVVTPGPCAACDGVDFNNDGLFPDTADIDDFLSVFSGGPCSNDPLCGDVDFNNDGLFPDTLDIDALLSVFSGGPCLF